MGWGSAPRPGRLYPWERPFTHCTGGWVGTRAGLEGKNTSSPPGFEGKRINFLHINITKDDNNFSFDIYRKHTTTDIIILNDSSQPREHNLAAIRYFSNRTKMYNLYHINRQKENNKLKQILHKNEYDFSILNKFSNTEIKRKQDIQRTKWAKFTYDGKETKFITKLFKNINVKIVLTTKAI